MTEEARSWSAALHPRAPAGSPAGGQFSAGSTQAAPSSQRPVGHGARGAQVRDLQQRLNQVGAGAPLKADGQFGPRTLAAVREFQRTHKDAQGKPLKVDGLVGPKTTWALRHASHAAPAHGHAHRALVLTLDELLRRTAQTAEAAAVHKPLGKPGGPGLFHHEGLQLPAYIQSVAQHLRAAHGESRAIEMAIGIVENWKNGHDGHGNRVHPDVQAAAAKAVAEWEADKARSPKVRRSAVATTQRAAMATADINNLPDSDFAFIKPGGTRDGSGRTVPRDLRFLPLHDAGHIRSALSRLPQSDLTDAQKAEALRKIRARAQKAGIEVSDGGGSASRSAAPELMRIYPLEDIHVLTRAEGDGSGRVVEAYATVFDQPAEIHDGQGHYTEVIDRTAFDQVLSWIRASRGGLAAQVKVLFNHGKTMEGVPAPEFQLPLGKPLDVRPEVRGLLTRTEYDASDPFTERVLSKIHAGTITAQSFVGGIMRSSPELRGPGDRYRRSGGTLTTVRRMVLGLREYGPVLFPAYSGAEILGVRMSLPGGDDVTATDGGFNQDEEYAPDMDGDVAGGAPEEAHPTRDHAHRLLVTRMEERCQRAGIVLPGRER